MIFWFQISSPVGMYQTVCAIGSPATASAASGEMQGGARAQQAMVVVDEVDEPVVDPLVIGHVGVGGMDADRLAHHLRQRPAAPHQIVIDVAGARLVAGEYPILELVVQMARVGSAIDAGYSIRHPSSPSRPVVRGCGARAGRFGSSNQPDTPPEM